MLKLKSYTDIFQASLSYVIVHPLEVVSRYRDTQLQVIEN